MIIKKSPTELKGMIYYDKYGNARTCLLEEPIILEGAMIKIIKSDGTYVSFDNLTTRQLELLEQFQQILKMGRDKKLTEKEVGYFLKQFTRNVI